jgi:hypothetical protein
MMKSSYGLVRDWVIKKMNLDEQIFKRLDKQILNQPMHENVIRFPDQNTLSTRVKQIRNPQKEISGGFFYDKIK